VPTPQPHPIYVLKAELFRVLGHPARVRILELLQEGERAVGDLQAELGLDSSGTSQHLAALRRIDAVEGRREGTSVLYSVRDPRFHELLRIGRALVMTRMEHSRAMLEDLT
jgi:ArsR family transcriptional regulator